MFRCVYAPTIGTDQPKVVETKYGVSFPESYAIKQLKIDLKNGKKLRVDKSIFTNTKFCLITADKTWTNNKILNIPCN